MRYGLGNLAPSDAEPVRNATVCGTDARGADFRARLTVIAHALQGILCALPVGCYQGCAEMFKIGPVTLLRGRDLTRIARMTRLGCVVGANPIAT